MEGNIQTVLDTRGALRCVRFESGNVGVVTTKGNTKLVVGPFQQLSFAENGFLRVFNGREFFIDMKNGEIYAHMPEFSENASLTSSTRWSARPTRRWMTPRSPASRPMPAQAAAAALECLRPTP